MIYMKHFDAKTSFVLLIIAGISAQSKNRPAPFEYPLFQPELELRAKEVQMLLGASSLGIPVTFNFRGLGSAPSVRG